MAAQQITGKTVVVTGGSRGIGLGLVKRFLERGNTVIATARQPADAAQLQQLLREQGGPSAAGQPRLHVTQLDTSSTASIREWAAGLRSQTATRHVDVLVNNAGIYGRRLPLAEFEPEDFLAAFQTNALGPFFVVQQLLAQGLLGNSHNHLTTAAASGATTTTSAVPTADAGTGADPALFPAPGSSLLVHVSSVMASHGDPTVSSVTGGGYAYRASKAALNIMSKAFALDLAKEGVSSLLIHPGYVSTDMNGHKGWISADESTTGILSVLESGKELNDRFYAYDGSEIPW